MKELNKQLRGIQTMLDHLKECISSGKSPEQCLSQIESIEHAVDDIWYSDPDNIPNDPNAEDNDWRTDQMKALSGEDWEDNHFGEEQAADLKKELGTEGISVNEPDTKDTSLSEQERWLIEALRDDPHDNRWED